MSKSKKLFISILIILISSSLSIIPDIPQEIITFIEGQLLPEVTPRNMKVLSDPEWDYTMIPSVSQYLFEDIDIIENLAPKGQVNRPGYIYDKHYICVHDTGDYSYGAKNWSDVVKNAKIGKRDYNMSFQYVVGNDGYYHNIPDNEIAYHAGDGHYNDSIFGLNVTGVYTDTKTDQKPKIEIDNEGYYLINGQRSLILAPTDDGKILTTDYINDLGIYSELKKEDNETRYQYYLGRTWYNPIFNKISNYGGNLNSIGIESCINHDTDVYYTWQKVAKLVAKLMNENNLDIDAVVQHHYFSGKNCPGTMRSINYWDYYKEMISSEYQILKYMEQGYKFELHSMSTYLNDKGRIIKIPEKNMEVSYQIIYYDPNGNSDSKIYITKIIVDEDIESDSTDESTDGSDISSDSSDISSDRSDHKGNNNKYLEYSLISILLLLLSIY